MVRKRLAARALLPVGAGRHPVPMGRHGRMDRKSRLLRHDHYRTARRPAVRLAQRQPEVYRKPAALRVGRDIGPVSHRRRLSAAAGDLLLYRLHFWHFQRDYVRFLRRCGAPVLYRTVAFGFLTFNRKSEPAEPESSKLLDTLLNWVLSPAVLAYTVLLYLYFAKIVATWSLPRGRIAYLVFGFTLIAVAAQAGQTLLNKRYYDWFYNRFSLISLPALAMFWVGVGCRWSDYGLTENRVYLIACGLIMTACMGLFLSRRIGRYLYVTLTAIVILALFTYIPGLTPRDIERWSQSGRPADRQDKSYRDDDKAESFYLWWEPLTEGIDLKGYSRLYEMRHWYSEDKADAALGEHRRFAFPVRRLEPGAAARIPRHHPRTAALRHRLPADRFDSRRHAAALPAAVAHLPVARREGLFRTDQPEPRLGDAHRRYPRKILLRAIAF
ncbi:MAG: DUF4153 domain-containing protein [Alistipes indistinctus]